MGWEGGGSCGGRRKTAVRRKATEEGGPDVTKQGSTPLCLTVGENVKSVQKAVGEAQK